MSLNWSVIGFVFVAMVIAVLISLSALGHFEYLAELWTNVMQMETYEKLMVFVPFALFGIGVGAFSEIVWRKR